MKLALTGLAILLPMALTLWAIIHVLTIAPFEEPLKRFGWLGVVTLLPVVGALIYLVCGRPRLKPQDPS